MIGYLCKLYIYKLLVHLFQDENNINYNGNSDIINNNRNITDIINNNNTINITTNNTNNNNINQTSIIMDYFNMNINEKYIFLILSGI